jgi:predicted dehydrogenase
MLRCDTHAYWYAPFMVRTDPLKLRENNPVCHHFFTSMYRPAQWVIPCERGMRLAKVWDPEFERARTFATTFSDKPEPCRSVEDMVAGVDAAFICCCDLNGSDHLEMARPFLKAGLPTFIDKPFAATWKDAKELVRLAEKHEAPLMSASLLSFTDQVPALLRRREEIGPMRFGIVKGANGWLTPGGREGICHSVAMALATFGYGVDWVESMGELPQEFILLHYVDGRRMLVVSMAGEYYGGRFAVEVWGRRSTSNTPVRTNIESGGVGDPEFLTAGPRVVRAFKRMVRTGGPPIAYARILDWMRVLEAARRAQAEHRRVRLREIR